jgi:5-methylcytosine-specific restriction protein A
MATVASLLPNRKRLVYDILKELKIDVSDWANYRKGKKKPPAANPEYCYDWAFEKADKFIVLCLWHNEMEEVSGSIIQIKNYRSRSTNPHPVRVRRAERADELLTKAYIHGLPIRIIINSSHEKNGGVKGRILDNTPWAVTSYDFDTGTHRLERGAPPEKNEGYEEVEYMAHEGEAWKRLSLITQRKREWRLRAAKIKDTLAKTTGV